MTADPALPVALKQTMPDIEKLAEPLGLMLHPAVPVQTKTVTLAVLAGAGIPVTATAAAATAATKSWRPPRIVVSFR